MFQRRLSEVISRKQLKKRQCLESEQRSKENETGKSLFPCPEKKFGVKVEEHHYRTNRDPGFTRKTTVVTTAGMGHSHLDLTTFEGPLFCEGF